MRVLRFWVGILLLATSFACGDCNGAPEPEQEISLELGPMPEEVPLGGAPYSEAQERAREEITYENAKELLDELERVIMHEREKLK